MKENNIKLDFWDYVNWTWGGYYSKEAMLEYFSHELRKHTIEFKITFIFATIFLVWAFMPLILARDVLWSLIFLTLPTMLYSFHLYTVIGYFRQKEDRSVVSERK